MLLFKAENKIYLKNKIEKLKKKDDLDFKDFDDFLRRLEECNRTQELIVVNQEIANLSLKLGEFDLIVLENYDNPEYQKVLIKFRDELKERDFFLTEQIGILRPKIEIIWYKFKLNNTQILEFMHESLLVNKQNTFLVLGQELKRCRKIIVNKLKNLIESKLLKIAKKNDRIVSKCEDLYEKLVQFLELWNEYFRLEDSNLEEREQVYEKIKKSALTFIESDLFKQDAKINDILSYMATN